MGITRYRRLLNLDITAPAYERADTQTVVELGLDS